MSITARVRDMLIATTNTAHYTHDRRTRELKGFLTCKINNCAGELPCIVGANFPGVMETSGKITMPLYVVNTKRATSPQAIFLAAMTYTTGLCRFITKNDEVFYGGRGMLFNSEMELLFLMNSTVTFQLDLISRDNARIEKKHLRISPKMLINHPVHSFWMKKAVPFYVEYTAPYMVITIEDLSDRVVHINAPNEPHLINTRAREVLRQRASNTVSFYD